jgi:hypothetical protein
MKRVCTPGIAMLCMEREDCIPTCSPSLRMGAMGDRAYPCRTRRSLWTLLSCMRVRTRAIGWTREGWTKCGVGSSTTIPSHCPHDRLTAEAGGCHSFGGEKMSADLAGGGTSRDALHGLSPLVSPWFNFSTSSTPASTLGHAGNGLCSPGPLE